MHRSLSFLLLFFLYKWWHRISRLKCNNDILIMHYMTHNRSHFSTISLELITIHSYHLDPKEEFTKCFISVIVDLDLTLELYWLFPSNQILVSINFAYLITSINIFFLMNSNIDNNSSSYYLYAMIWIYDTHSLWMDDEIPLIHS